MLAAKANYSPAQTKVKTMYQNWQAICTIPDHHFMLALAVLDPDTAFGQVVIERFPEYFTTEAQPGPIPLSLLRQKANEQATEDGYPDEYDSLVSDGACKHFNIPTHGFGGMYELLPPELSHLKELKGIGHVVTWRGKEFVVVQNDENYDDYVGGNIFLAPADRVAVGY